MDGSAYNYGNWSHLGRDLLIVAAVLIAIGFGLGWLVFA